MFRKILKFSIISLIFLSFFLLPVFADASVWVDGYYRNNGTYVRGHYRSSPDGNPYTNWSFPGNTNPYTGETATGNPSTYLDNYYNRNTGSSWNIGNSWNSGSSWNTGNSFNFGW